MSGKQSQPDPTTFPAPFIITDKRKRTQPKPPPALETIVWADTVDDGKFEAVVLWKKEYEGRLLVTVAETKEVLLDEGVDVAYNAAFGPDTSDLISWQALAIAAIDEWIEANPNG